MKIDFEAISRWHVLDAFRVFEDLPSLRLGALL
eukprot:CAMPEP_0170476738 /NCGR_PEP_ID=MMETSP0123-20130129/18098_1 /TAXON_ID=182087 /ORGANISM="Favella ehrenbergii, Strain Fehren 1" /LENGTH=32 /DNA_ID= /DNA_START= /DNA_END= /DNA_ORIENTATION=